MRLVRAARVTIHALFWLDPQTDDWAADYVQFSDTQRSRPYIFLQEGATDGCPLLSSEGQREFPYRALTAVRDIEELAELGKRDGTCAYYGARKAAALAQVRP